MITQDLTAADLVSDLNQYIAWTAKLLKADQETETWDSWSDAGTVIHARVEALPNTHENLAIRVLAITGIVSDSTDPACIELGELAAYSEGIAGRLIKQVLLCISDRSAE